MTEATGRGRRPTSNSRRLVGGLTATVIAVLAILLIGGSPAGATPSYVPISGEGSSWSANAIDQWIADV